MRGLITLFLLLFALGCRTAHPGVAWGEGPLLTIGAYRLGISHPPGYSLYLQFAHPVMMLPVGSLAFRLNIWSSFWHAATWTLLAAFLQRRGYGIALSTIAVLFPALGSEAWRMAGLAEVYTLNSFLFVAVFIAGDRIYREASLKNCALGLFLWGLALAHHMTMIFGGFLLLPGLVRAGPLRIFRASSFLPLGLSAYLYFPLRAVSGAVPNWGTPWDFAHFFRLIVAKEEVVPSVGLVMDQLAAVPFLARLTSQSIWEEVGVTGLLLMVHGVYVVARQRSGALLGAALCSVTLFVAVVLYQSNERFAFLMPALVVLTPLLAMSLRALHSAFSPRQPVALYAILGLVLIHRGMSHFEGVDRSRAWYIGQFARACLAPLPERTVIFTEESDRYFLTAYLGQIERNHRDAMPLFFHLLRFPWYYELTYETWHSIYWVPSTEALRQSGALGFLDAISESLLTLNHKFLSAYLLDTSFFGRHLHPLQKGWGVMPNGYSYQLVRGNMPEPLEPDLSLFDDYITQGFVGQDQLTTDLFSRHLYFMGLAYASWGSWDTAILCMEKSLECTPRALEARESILAALKEFRLRRAESSR